MGIISIKRVPVPPVRSDNPTLKIPKKYQHTIEEWYHDSDGYWVKLKPGYIDGGTGTGWIHEDTQKRTLEAIREVYYEEG